VSTHLTYLLHHLHSRHSSLPFSSTLNPRHHLFHKSFWLIFSALVVVYTAYCALQIVLLTLYSHRRSSPRDWAAFTDSVLLNSFFCFSFFHYLFCFRVCGTKLTVWSAFGMVTLNLKDTFSLNPSHHRPHPSIGLPLRTPDCSMVFFLVLFPLTF